MAPIRLKQAIRPADPALPLDVMLAGVLMAMAWAFAGYLGVRLLDPRSDLATSVLILALIAAYQVCAFAVAARARRPRR